VQSRMMSAVEAAANVGIGYLVAIAATAVILPIFGYRVTAQDAIGISAAFTVVSLLRSYALRRLFNWMGSR
jgi:hypothetical protein